MVNRFLTLAVALSILLFPVAARAACAGSGQAWSCPANATTSDVSDAISGAADGATITFATGAYTLDFAGFSTDKGVTLACANAGGCTVAATSYVFGFSGWNAGTFDHLYRITGFVFNETGQTPIMWGTGCNPCSGGTFTKIRIDHNTFNLSPGSVAVLLDGNINVGNAFYGVIDHNTVASSEQAGIFQWIGAMGKPTPPASQLGTGNNMFIEDNTLDFPSVGNASALGCMDAWGVMAGLVVRHNTSKNCLWTTHGVTHGGGPSNVEFYANAVTMDSGATSAGVADGYRSFHHQGSGTFVAFDNAFTAFNGKNGEVISVAHYRDFLNSIDNGLPICDGTQTIASRRQSRADGDVAGLSVLEPTGSRRRDARVQTDVRVEQRVDRHEGRDHARLARLRRHARLSRAPHGGGSRLVQRRVRVRAIIGERSVRRHEGHGLRHDGESSGDVHDEHRDRVRKWRGGRGRFREGRRTAGHALHVLRDEHVDRVLHAVHVSAPARRPSRFW